jgi:hypothetical protein
MEKQLTEKERKEQAEQLAHGLHKEMRENPTIWRATALKFKRVADLVLIEIEKDDKAARNFNERQIPIDDTYVYLMSVAIENLLKCILASKGESFEALVSFDHELVELYNKCCHDHGLTPRKDDRKLLDILTHSAIWAGRYNLPKNEKTLVAAFMKHGLHAEAGLNVPSRSGSIVEQNEQKRSEREEIKSLYERLSQFLDANSAPKRSRSS